MSYAVSGDEITEGLQLTCKFYGSQQDLAGLQTRVTKFVLEQKRQNAEFLKNQAEAQQEMKLRQEEISKRFQAQTTKLVEGCFRTLLPGLFLMIAAIVLIIGGFHAALPLVVASFGWAFLSRCVSVFTVGNQEAVGFSLRRPWAKPFIW